MKNKILAADDSRVMLRVVSEAIRRVGYEPLEATSGVEALSALGTHMDEVELVLLDLNMPSMDGLSTMRMMSNHRRLAAIPVVLMTAQDDERIGAAAAQYGCCRRIAKPFTVDILEARLRVLLEEIKRDAAVPGA
jgi:two-component system, OmpR family, KDP operon response regulator KdpE